MFIAEPVQFIANTAIHVAYAFLCRRNSQSQRHQVIRLSRSAFNLSRFPDSINDDERASELESKRERQEAKGKQHSPLLFSFSNREYTCWCTHRSLHTVRGANRKSEETIEGKTMLLLY